MFELASFRVIHCKTVFPVFPKQNPQLKSVLKLNLPVIKILKIKSEHAAFILFQVFDCACMSE